MSYCDTSEQVVIIGWPGHCLMVRAFACIVITSTLARLAQANLHYLAYSYAVRDEAEQIFPFNVECQTSYQLAWPNFGRYYEHRLTGDLWSTDVARQLSTRHLPLARVAITIFNTFLCSGDREFGPQHLPEEGGHNGLSADKILAAAQMLRRESARLDGTFPVTHDFYLKLYQLSQLDFSKLRQTLLFDEEKNANSVMQSPVLARSHSVVLVGDRHQHIYRFCGAEKALDAPALDNVDQLYLTHSFLFGPAVAQAANILLARQGERGSVGGEGRNDRGVGSTPEYVKGLFVTILSRTVAGVIDAALGTGLAGKQVHWVGGISSYKTEELEDLYWFSEDMPERIQSPHFSRGYRNFEVYELVARATRDVEMNQGLRLLELYFPLPQKLQVMRKHTVTEESLTQVTVSTVHRGKGLECPVVVLNHDFADITAPLMADCERTDEINLLYAAVTRAREMLVLNELLQVVMDNEGNDIAGDLAC
ncbi:TPA: ATP-binding domain-containing protein [Serratia marcescens]|nr:DNA helicase [Serratia marcescens]HEI8504926.1 ATP-binding domain-containing protein [Serratia marcescens]